MLKASDIVKAEHLLMDVRDARRNLIVATRSADVLITIGDVRTGLCGADAETVREIAVANIKARLAAAEAELLLMGVDSGA
jgi:hypothetical protein